ncbi:MAG: biotin-dependent carboxyltransferase family protein [Limnobacter sp.]|nr:biotin-dependent carboxyltransferase family protein [Limnobacter sp.]
MLKLIRASGLATVQDSGRRGYLSQGVPVSGVLDTLSFKMANMALGNTDEAACIEFMGRFDWVCAEPCVAMLASRHGRMTVNKQDKQSGQLVELQDGDIIQMESQPYAPWGLFCMAGGVQVPLVMGSRSTCSVAAFGGYLGRTLKSGDVIRVGAKTATETLQKELNTQRRLALPSSVGEDAQVVRFIPGPDYSTLPSQTQGEFTQQTYRVSSQASRMGYRLDGMPLQLGPLTSGPSYVAQPGLIQLPPSGFPIVLLADAQATGGYPRLGTVIQADLWKFAHWGSGQPLRFLPTSFDEARHALQEQSRDLMRVKVALA